MFRFPRRPARRFLLVALTTLALVAAVSAPGTVSLANLGGSPASNFQSADGNLTTATTVPATPSDETDDLPGTIDWATLGASGAIVCPAVPVAVTDPTVGTNCGMDWIRSGVDNSFGQGSKEDIDPPTVVDGSIPPNKSDLSRFYFAKQPATGPTDFVYLAWERTNTLGTANMDFEFNQGTTLSANGVTVTRQAGDILITYDFVRGGKTPVLGLLRWITGAPGTVADCFSSNSLPCWGSRIVLSSTGLADGAVNDDCTPLGSLGCPGSVVDPIGPNALRTLDVEEFGEAAIRGAAFFPTNQCVNFGSAFLKSRSSASFTAEMKDFIAPIPVQIGNCGPLTVHKYIDADESGTQNSGDTNTGTDVNGWTFTVTGPSGTGTCSTDSNGNLPTTTCGSLNLSQLIPGSYTITETTANASRTIDTAASTFNTDPGGALPVSKTVTVTAGTTATNVVFGNTCFITKTFRITDVPSGESGLFAFYTIDSGPNSGTTVYKVALTQVGTTGTWTGTAGAFHITNSITWGYGINLGTANEQTAPGTSPASFATAGYPACAETNSRRALPSNVTGTKYKDVNSNGTNDNGDQPLGGFTFQLLNGTTVVQSATSDSLGNYTFSNVLPGGYTVHEVGQTGWRQTEPASNADRSVTVLLEQNATVAAFGNTPLSDITVTFTADATLPGTSTPATHATITCTGASPSTSGSLTLSNQTIGSYTCTIVITDP